MEPNTSEIGLKEDSSSSPTSSQPQPVKSTEAFGTLHLEAHARWLGLELQINARPPKRVKSQQDQQNDRQNGTHRETYPLS